MSDLGWRYPSNKIRCGVSNLKVPKLVNVHDFNVSFESGSISVIPSSRSETLAHSCFFTPTLDFNINIARLSSLSPHHQKCNIQQLFSQLAG